MRAHCRRRELWWREIGCSRNEQRASSPGSGGEHWVGWWLSSHAPHQQLWHHLGACWKCRFSGPPPRSTESKTLGVGLARNLCFNEASRWFWPTLRFKNPWCRASAPRDGEDTQSITGLSFPPPDGVPSPQSHGQLVRRAELLAPCSIPVKQGWLDRLRDTNVLFWVVRSLKWEKSGGYLFLRLLSLSYYFQKYRSLTITVGGGHRLFPETLQRVINKLTSKKPLFCVPLNVNA